MDKGRGQKSQLFDGKKEHSKNFIPDIFVFGI